MVANGIRKLIGVFVVKQSVFLRCRVELLADAEMGKYGIQ